MTAQNTVLDVQSLSKNFGNTKVLNSINMEIGQGDFLVLVGPSGCGKSTLLNCIAGLEQLSRGKILIGGGDMTQTPPKDRDIAMVFQSYALYPTMTVEKNITFGMKVRGISDNEQKMQLERVSGLLKIDHLLDRKPAQLSGGQRQRVAMGRALVRDPKLFLFDEPLSNLDAKLRVEMRAEIKRLHQRLNATIVYVTHDQMEAMSLATQIAVMDGGEIAQLAAPQYIYDNPANLFVAGFIGSPSMNFLDGQMKVNGSSKALEIHANGKTMLLAMDHYKFANGVTDGQDVVLGIRPEYVTGATQPTEHEHIIELDLEPLMVETSGFDQHAMLQFGSQEIGGRFTPREEILVGQKIRTRIDLESVSIFDRSSTNRI